MTCPTPLFSTLPSIRGGVILGCTYLRVMIDIEEEEEEIFLSYRGHTELVQLSAYRGSSHRRMTYAYSPQVLYPIIALNYTPCI